MQKPPLLTRLLALFLAFTMAGPVRAASPLSTYVVGAGDKLFVDFPLRGSPSDLQPLGGNGMTLVIVGEAVFFRYEATVAPDGFISLPSMGPIKVEGLTLEEVRTTIVQHLKNFSLRDTVSVMLATPNSRAFVVLGAVTHPGRFVYERPTTLAEALALAGGTTPYANMKKIQLCRRGQPPVSFDLSDDEIMKSGISQITVFPDDSVIVPRRWFTPDSTVILIVLSAITAAVSVYAVTK